MPSPSGEHGRFQSFALACVSHTDGAVLQRVCVRSVGRGLGKQPTARAGQSRVVNLKRFLWSRGMPLLLHFGGMLTGTRRIRS